MFVDHVGLRKNFLAAAGHSSGALLPLIPNKTTPPHRGSVTCQVASPQIPTKLSPTSTPNAEPPRLRRLHCGKALEAVKKSAPPGRLMFDFPAAPPPALREGSRLLGPRPKKSLRGYAAAATNATPPKSDSICQSAPAGQASDFAQKGRLECFPDT